MSDSPANSRIERLKAVKSAFILEARSLSERGSPTFAIPLFRRAAELECELAELFGARKDQRNRAVSLLSAGSCFVEARQYRTAARTLAEVADQFPEAKQLIAECGDKEDLPAPVEPPALQSLIDLMVRKGLITEDDWADAIRAK